MTAGNVIEVRFAKIGEVTLGVGVAEGATVAQAIETIRTAYARQNGGRALETTGYSWRVDGERPDMNEIVEEGTVFTLVGEVKGGLR